MERGKNYIYLADQTTAEAAAAGVVRTRQFDSPAGNRRPACQHFGESLDCKGAADLAVVEIQAWFRVVDWLDSNRRAAIGLADTVVENCWRSRTPILSAMFPTVDSKRGTPIAICQRARVYFLSH